jgi:pimeloyl-ACP methyl ester carboxylesterase
MLVPSSDGVQLAVHDLGGTGAALLVSHATGFHGRCYLPLAAELAASATASRSTTAATATPPAPTAPSTGRRYGDDAVAMATWLAERSGGPIDAFGHSMGGACLLMAAHRHPELFRRIIAFEPIVFPPEGLQRSTRGCGEPDGCGCTAPAPSFPSYEAAIANYAAKPPLNSFTPAALEAYVRFGFAQGADGGAPEVQPRHRGGHVRHRRPAPHVGRAPRHPYRGAGGRRRRAADAAVTHRGGCGRAAPRTAATCSATSWITSVR